MLNLLCIVKPVVYTRKNTEENIAALDASGKAYKVTSEGLTFPDKNGLPAILLTTIAGKSVNRNLISGSVAKKDGFEVGKMYGCMVQEKKADDYGRQFSFVNAGEIPVWQLGQAMESMGELDIIDVTKSTVSSKNEIEAEEAEVEQFA